MDDNAKVLFGIHDEIYDFTDFREKYPGTEYSELSKVSNLITVEMPFVFEVRSRCSYDKMRKNIIYEQNYNRFISYHHFRI